MLLRKITSDDVPAIFKMRSDPRVMRYIGRPVQKELSEALQLVEALRVCSLGYNTNVL